MGDRRELIPDDMGMLLRVAMKGWQTGIWTALPGVIVEFDAAKQTCSVQPTIQGQFENPDGSMYWLTMPLLTDCPLVFPNAGGFALTFPVVSGDEVLVVFASRCIDSWWQSGGVQIQAELRMHDLSDGFVIPGPRSQTRTLPGYATDKVQLRNEVGTSSVSILANGDVAVVSPGKVTVTAQEADVTAPVIKLTGNVEIIGNLSITGTTVGEGEGTFLTTNVHNHQHGGVTNGPSKTSPPSNIIPPLP